MSGPRLFWHGAALPFARDGVAQTFDTRRRKLRTGCLRRVVDSWEGTPHLKRLGIARDTPKPPSPSRHFEGVGPSHAQLRPDEAGRRLNYRWTWLRRATEQIRRAVRLAALRDMIAAIYARKSTDQRVADEAKSVTRQVEHARAYATRRAGRSTRRTSTSTTASPAPSSLKRPGFLRLMNALKPRPPFQVLVMSRGVPPRPRADRDGLRAEADRHGGRARLLLPGRPRAHPRLARPTS